MQQITYMQQDIATILPACCHQFAKMASTTSKHVPTRTENLSILFWPVHFRGPGKPKASVVTASGFLQVISNFTLWKTKQKKMYISQRSVYSFLRILRDPWVSLGSLEFRGFLGIPVAPWDPKRIFSTIFKDS